MCVRERERGRSEREMERESMRGQQGVACAAVAVAALLLLLILMLMRLPNETHHSSTSTPNSPLLTLTFSPSLLLAFIPFVDLALCGSLIYFIASFTDKLRSFSTRCCPCPKLPLSLQPQPLLHPLPQPLSLPSSKSRYFL